MVAAASAAGPDVAGPAPHAHITGRAGAGIHVTKEDLAVDGAWAQTLRDDLQTSAGDCPLRRDVGGKIGAAAQHEAGPARSPGASRVVEATTL